jgi:hypothetical protein
VERPAPARTPGPPPLPAHPLPAIAPPPPSLLNPSLGRN